MKPDMAGERSDRPQNSFCNEEERQQDNKTNKAHVSTTHQIKCKLPTHARNLLSVREAIFRQLRTNSTEPACSIMPKVHSKRMPCHSGTPNRDPSPSIRREWPPTPSFNQHNPRKRPNHALHQRGDAGLKPRF